MIYERVAEYCRDAKMSISKFEKLCGIGNGAVGRWRGGNTSPSIATLTKMEKATGIPIRLWLGGDLR